MTEEKQEKYNIVIPSEVVIRKNLASTAKLLYGEIALVCSDQGYCMEENNYFAARLNKDSRSIARYVSLLRKCKFIKCKFRYKYIRLIFLPDTEQEYIKEICRKYGRKHDAADKYGKRMRYNYVYFIKFKSRIGDKTVYKIGISMDPIRRLATYSNNDVLFERTLLFCEGFVNSEEIEEKVKVKFRNKIILGKEWFELSKKDVCIILKLLKTSLKSKDKTVYFSRQNCRDNTTYYEHEHLENAHASDDFRVETKIWKDKEGVKHGRDSIDYEEQ